MLGRWQNLANFCQSGYILKVFGNCLSVDLIFSKILELICNFSMLLDTFSLLQIGKFGEINAAIWSHWLGPVTI